MRQKDRRLMAAAQREMAMEQGFLELPSPVVGFAGLLNKRQELLGANLDDIRAAVHRDLLALADLHQLGVTRS
jgi:hypothetical protein